MISRKQKSIANYLMKGQVINTKLSPKTRYYHIVVRLRSFGLCLCLAFLNWDSQQGRDLATSGRNKQIFQLGQCYFYIMRKDWYHQIWSQNKSFMVSDLMYIPTKHENLEKCSLSIKTIAKTYDEKEMKLSTVNWKFCYI